MQFISINSIKTIDSLDLCFSRLNESGKLSAKKKERMLIVAGIIIAL